MSNKTINELDALSGSDVLDVVPIWDTDLSATKKATLSQILHGASPNKRFANESNFSGINSVVADIGSVNITTLIVSDSQTLTGNLNVTDNINLIIEAGGEIVKASTYTLNIENLIAGSYKIFDGFSAGNVSLGKGVEETLPEWWGIDGTADEVQINLAADALDAGVVLLGHRTYSTAAAITLPTGITLRGMNSTVSKIVPASTMVKIITTANGATDVIVEDIWVYGTGTTNIVERGIFGDSPTRLIVRNCRFGNMTYGVHIETGTRCDIINNHFDGIVGAAGVTEGYGTLITLDSEGCKVLGNTYKTIARIPIYCTSGTSNTIIEGNSTDTSAEGGIALNATIAQNPCVGNQIIGNNIKNVTSAGNDGHGINVSVHCFDTTIIGNTLENINDFGIYMNSPESGADTAKKVLRGVIANNVIDTADIGINIKNAEDFVVTGNNVFNTTSQGILVSTSGSSAVCHVNRISISGNKVRTTGGDGIAFGVAAGQSEGITLGRNDTTDVTGTDIVQNLGIVGFRNIMNPVWIEDVITFSDLDAVSATPTHNFTISLPPGVIVDGVWWNLDTEFAGGSVSAATLEFGITGIDVDGFFPAENVFTGAGIGLKDSDITSRGALLYSAGATQTLQYFVASTRVPVVTLRLTGDTGDALTAGQVRIWISYHQVKLLTT